MDLCDLAFQRSDAMFDLTHVITQPINRSADVWEMFNDCGVSFGHSFPNITKLSERN